MSLPLPPDEETVTFYQPIWRRTVTYVRHAKTKRFIRMLRAIRVIVTIRADYLNPARPGHRLTVELTAHQAIALEDVDDPDAEARHAADQLKARIEKAYAEACTRKGLPDLREEEHTDVSVQVDFEEAPAEEPYTEEEIEWTH